ncbi:hypothetical protein V6N13_010592 [Hibiscus sabdariffa]
MERETNLMGRESSREPNEPKLPLALDETTPSSSSSPLFPDDPIDDELSDDTSSSFRKKQEEPIFFSSGRRSMTNVAVVVAVAVAAAAAASMPNEGPARTSIPSHKSTSSIFPSFKKKQKYSGIKEKMRRIKR